jgi:hypothetical protein
MENNLGYLSVSSEPNRVEHITVRVTLPSNIRLNLAGTNTLAYFASKTGKMFVTLTLAGFIFIFQRKFLKFLRDLGQKKSVTFFPMVQCCHCCVDI